METEEDRPAMPGQDDPQPAVEEQPPGQDVPGPDMDNPAGPNPGEDTHSPLPGQTVSNED